MVSLLILGQQSLTTEAHMQKSLLFCLNIFYREKRCQFSTIRSNLLEVHPFKTKI